MNGRANRLWIRAAVWVMLACSASASNAAYILTAVNTPVIEQFTSYPGLVAPDNWTLAAVSGPPFFNGTNNGTSTGGGFYSYGANGNSNRALGYLGNSGTQESITNAATFTNSTGETITQLALSFDAQQWHSAGSGGTRINGWAVSISTDGGMSYAPVTVGNLSSWLSSNTLGGGIGGAPVDGYTQSSTRSGTLTGLSIANGTNFLLRWSSNQGIGTGFSQGIAIDNVSVTAVPEPTATVLGGLAALAAAAAARRFRRRTG